MYILTPSDHRTLICLSCSTMQARFYENPGTKICAAFLANNNSRVAATASFRGVDYYLPPRSISILPDCKTVVFNTQTVTPDWSLTCLSIYSIEEIRPDYLIFGCLSMSKGSILLLNKNRLYLNIMQETSRDQRLQRTLHGRCPQNSSQLSSNCQLIPGSQRSSITCSRIPRTMHGTPPGK